MDDYLDFQSFIDWYCGEFPDDREALSLCAALGYTSVYHLGLMLDKRPILRNDFIQGFKKDGGVIHPAQTLAKEAADIGIGVSQLAGIWGVSREYIYRNTNSPLLRTALVAVSERVGELTVRAKTPDEECSPECLLTLIAERRPLWRPFDLLAWWTPINGSAYVQRLGAVLQEKRRVRGPLVHMLLDAVVGMPIAPPAVASMDDAKRARALSHQMMVKILEEKGWHRSELEQRWNFRDRRHLHRVLCSAATHPHVADAILGLPDRSLVPKIQTKN